MALITDTYINVDLVDTQVVLVKAHQYDTQSRYLHIKVTEHGEEITLTQDMTCYYKQATPAGTYILNLATIDTVNNWVDVELTSYCTAVAGKSDSELLFAVLTKALNDDISVFDEDNTYEIGQQVYYEGELYECTSPVTIPQDFNPSNWELITSRVITTMPFSIVVEESVYDGNEVPESSYDALNQVLADYQNVMGAIEDANRAAKTSESWAVGGTNTRSGEDSNNSKYWSEKSYEYASSITTQAILSESWAIGGTGERSDEDTNNSKYFATQSSASASSSNSYANTSRNYSLISEGYALGTQNGTAVSGGTYYQNNAKYWADIAKQYGQTVLDYESTYLTYVEQCADYVDDCSDYSLVSEGYALGTQNGVAVSSGTYYQNNAKYWADLSEEYYSNMQNYEAILGGYADAAASSATSAENSYANAQALVDSLDDQVSQAASYASTASAASASAATYRDNASNSATLAQSWAVGGTGRRVGEDTNNARYWSNQVQSLKTLIDLLNTEFSGTILASGWTASEDTTYYTQTVAISGLIADLNVLWQAVQDPTAYDADLDDESANIYYAVTSDGAVTFYSTAETIVDIPFTLTVVSYTPSTE